LPPVNRRTPSDSFCATLNRVSPASTR